MELPTLIERKDNQNKRRGGFGRFGKRGGRGGNNNNILNKKRGRLREIDFSEIKEDQPQSKNLNINQNSKVLSNPIITNIHNNTNKNENKNINQSTLNSSINQNNNNLYTNINQDLNAILTSNPTQISTQNLLNLNNNNENKKTLFVDAKKEIEEFSQMIEKVEEEIIKKYNITIPNFSYEDTFPEEIKNKLLDNFLETPEIEEILTKVGNS